MIRCFRRAILSIALSVPAWSNSTASHVNVTGYVPNAEVTVSNPPLSRTVRTNKDGSVLISGRSAWRVHSADSVRRVFGLFNRSSESGRSPNSFPHHNEQTGWRGPQYPDRTGLPLLRPEVVSRFLIQLMKAKENDPSWIHRWMPSTPPIA